MHSIVRYVQSLFRYRSSFLEITCQSRLATLTLLNEWDKNWALTLVVANKVREIFTIVETEVPIAQGPPRIMEPRQRSGTPIKVPAGTAISGPGTRTEEASGPPRSGTKSNVIHRIR